MLLRHKAQQRKWTRRGFEPPRLVLDASQIAASRTKSSFHAYVGVGGRSVMVELPQQ